ncbi:unnamed protein product [Pleuronectes platessa]|uniref:Uncharacterized protein n=1 Tax=Pleuronectes platessa TaxID=8262 RepID=A0A9N7VKU1_PLEPL|nr:unnamed protein product [Pleuronectes platessa]
MVIGGRRRSPGRKPSMLERHVRLAQHHRLRETRGAREETPAGYEIQDRCCGHIVYQDDESVTVSIPNAKAIQITLVLSTSRPDVIGLQTSAPVPAMRVRSIQHLARARRGDSCSPLTPPLNLTCSVRFTQADLDRPRCSTQSSSSSSPAAEHDAMVGEGKLEGVASAGQGRQHQVLQLLLQDEQPRCWGNPLRAQHHGAFPCAS